MDRNYLGNHNGNGASNGHHALTGAARIAHLLETFWTDELADEPAATDLVVPQSDTESAGKARFAEMVAAYASNVGWVFTAAEKEANGLRRTLGLSVSAFDYYRTHPGRLPLGLATRLVDVLQVNKRSRLTTIDQARWLEQIEGSLMTATRWIMKANLARLAVTVAEANGVSIDDVLGRDLKSAYPVVAGYPLSVDGFAQLPIDLQRTLEQTVSRIYVHSRRKYRPRV